MFRKMICAHIFIDEKVAIAKLVPEVYCVRRALLLTFSLIFVPTAQSSETPYWQQSVHYTMDVSLIPIDHALSGEERIVYKNNSPDTLHQFYLHLYPNAFRSNETVKAGEARRAYRKLLKDPEDAGYIEIESFRILSSDSAQKAVTAFQVNDTILEASLPEPLPPGGELTVELSFYLKVRKFQERAGYRGFQYDFAQWYPKVCVYDETGWNAEPFHLTGEFYGEFGTFDVTINVPYEYVVGATGVVVSGDPGWERVQVDTSLSPQEWEEAFKKIQRAVGEDARDGKIRTVIFRAENVHDFAWVASPDFLYERGEWDGIPIHVLYRSYVKKRWSKVAAEHGARSLAWLSDKFGRYPYPQLTITHGLLGGGMEYPMLVMNARENEGLVLHEVGHIYFFGILANNEWKEAWLDEGFTTFQTRWYMETRYSESGIDSEGELPSRNWLQRRRPRHSRREQGINQVMAYLTSGHNEPISREAYRYNESISYRRNAYDKGSFFYDMLKYVVGDSIFENICREYFERWAFKHVNEARFRQVCEDVSGQKLDWFFRQWLHDSVTVDYALGSVKRKEFAEGWETKVEIHRKDRGIMPVEVLLITQAGDSLWQRWDGKEQAGAVVFYSTSRPQKAILDPRDAILDKSRLNHGAVKVRWLFDYPNMSYYPRDVYLVTYRPSLWYNEVDKLRIGGRLLGDYGASRNAYLGAWFGVDSQELDGRLRYSNPITPLGPDIRGTFSAQKMEGRFEIDAHLTLLKRKYLELPPVHQVVVGFNHSRLLKRRGEQYVIREYDQKDDVEMATWGRGNVNNFYLRYGVNPRGLLWFTNFTLGFDVVDKDWGSEVSYHTGFSELRVCFPKNDEGVFLRFFAGKIFSSDDALIQDLLFLDGANPRDRFRRFYLRSDGALPEELHYHLPGGGNLRGYYNQPIFGDQILAANLELRKKLKPNVLGRWLRSVLGHPGVAVFGDLSTMEFVDSRHEFFADAGLGLRFENLLPDDWYTIFTGGRNTTLRLDFPIWVNQPLPGENAVRFRWVFGFEQAL
ncbi:MAG TPA: M1 family metallopeptidase [bacterium]